MDKRYQVFVSSTFTDLEEERKHVIQTLMEMDCIPAGMELFPAIDEEQWEFIQKVIDDCDYYLLIIGGRYGSTTEDGLSYTEKEFNYAVTKGLKVIVLIHEEPDSLPAKKTELNPESREKLTKFISKAQTGRLRRTWKTVQELPGLVALSMTKTIKTYPATGWVRANSLANEENLSELIKAKNEIAKLQSRLDEIASFSLIDSSSLESKDLNKSIMVNFKNVSIYDHEDSSSESIKLKLLTAFNYIAPNLMGGNQRNNIINYVESLIVREKGLSESFVKIYKNDFSTIEICLMATQLVTIDGDWWTLTDKGMKLLMELRLNELE